MQHGLCIAQSQKKVDRARCLQVPAGRNSADSKNRRDFFASCNRLKTASSKQQERQAAYAGISSRIAGGSSPSHSGFSAVPSNIDDVLKGSNLPFAAAARVFPRRALRSSLLSG